MMDTSYNRETPTVESVGELLLALMEKRAGVVLPDGQADQKPYYLQDGKAALIQAFSGAIGDAINEFGTWGQSQTTSTNSERIIAERTISLLESTPESHHDLTTIAILAIDRYRDARRRMIRMLR